jgi:hypothetical protein
LSNVSVYEPGPTEAEQAERIAEEKARTEELKRAPRNLRFLHAAEAAE